MQGQLRWGKEVVFRRAMLRWGLRCTRLGDTAYTALAKHCPNIEVLRMYASMPSALAIQGCGALSHLRVIDLCGAHAATGIPCFVVFAADLTLSLDTYRQFLSFLVSGWSHSILLFWVLPLWECRAGLWRANPCMHCPQGICHLIEKQQGMLLGGARPGNI